MNCHGCENVRYDGCRRGRCALPGHADVRFGPGEDGKRQYRKLICPDYRLKKRCSNCRYWSRGEYYGDGRTPAKKGRCSLKLMEDASSCSLWSRGKTSWKRRKGSMHPPA